MAEKVFKKITRTIFLLAVPVLVISALSGCGASAGVGLNPFSLLTKVDSVDHTPFFIASYNAFLTQGLAVAQSQTTLLQQTQQTSQATSSLTSTISGLTGQ